MALQAKWTSQVSLFVIGGAPKELEKFRFVLWKYGEKKVIVSNPVSTAGEPVLAVVLPRPELLERPNFEQIQNELQTTPLNIRTNP